MSKTFFFRDARTGRAPPDLEQLPPFAASCAEAPAKAASKTGVAGDSGCASAPADTDCPSSMHLLILARHFAAFSRLVSADAFQLLAWTKSAVMMTGACGESWQASMHANCRS